MQKSTGRSYISFIGSMLIFGTIGIFRRYIPISSALLAFTRGMMGSACLLIFLLLSRKKPLKSINKANVLPLVISGAFMGLNWILLFEAYSYTTIATATLCYYMQPTILILLSPLIFKEKLGGRKLVCAGVSLLGMVLVSGVLASSSFEPSEYKGVLLGLGAAVLYAAVVICNKLLTDVDSYDRCIIQLFSAAAVLIPYLALSGNAGAYDLTNVAVIMIIIVGLVHTGLAYVLYFSGMKDLSAQSVAVLGYIDPVSSMILAALILGERMSAGGLAGAVMIIGATLYSELKCN